MLRVGDLPGEVERRFAGFNPATVAAHIDLDINRHRHSGLGRGRLERVHLAPIVGAHPDPGD